MLLLLLAIIGLVLFCIIRKKKAEEQAQNTSDAVEQDQIPDEILAVFIAAIAEAEDRNEELSQQELLAIISAAISEYEGTHKSALSV